MSLQITSLIAALMGLMMVPLSFRVSLRRRHLKTSFGDADDELLRRSIRAHGNFVEYAPTALILLALVEWNGAPAMLTWSLAIAFLAARVLHAYGMLYTAGHGARGIGMLVQHLSFLLAAAWLLFDFSL
jgi:hypothetical protein